MTPSKKSVAQTHRDIAQILGGPMRNAVAPFIVSAGLMQWAISPFEDDFPLLLVWSVGLGAALLLSIIIRYVLMPFNGRLILRDIENDYGPKTRKYVLDKFAAAKDGDFIELDIPAVARLYREG